MRTVASKCKTAFDLWRVSQASRRKEVTYAPPRDLVRLVKLGLSDQDRALSQKWMFASMVFDSLKRPLPAGVSQGCGGQQRGRWSTKAKA